MKFIKSHGYIIRQDLILVVDKKFHDNKVTPAPICVDYPSYKWMVSIKFTNGTSNRFEFDTEEEINNFIYEITEL